MDEIVTEILKDSDIKPSGTVNDYLTVMDNYMPELVAHPVVDENIDKICALLDVAGYNYMTSRYEADAVNYPDRVMVGSETYPPQIAKNWEIIKRTDSVIGDFTWTGWDYMGESGIGMSVILTLPVFEDRCLTIGSLFLNRQRHRILPFRIRSITGKNQC